MQITPYQEVASLCFGVQDEGLLSSIPEELVKHLFSLLSCRSIAKVSFLNKKWQIYSGEILKKYKFALFDTAFHLWHAFKLYNPIEANNPIDVNSLKESFMREYLPASRPSSFEKITSVMKEIGSKPRVSEQMFSGISKLNQRLKQDCSTLLVPPSNNNRMTKHAVVYLHRALNFENIFYICPNSVYQQLEVLSKKKIVRLLIHPIFCNNPQILNAFKMHLPSFKPLISVVVTSCHLDIMRKGALLPLLKVISQVDSLRYVDFLHSNLSNYDFYSVLAWIRLQENQALSVRFDRETFVKWSGI
jgi:hypothetical protein